MPEDLFLDPEKHPYVVVSGKGVTLARFSNLPCAAHTVTLRHKRNPGIVRTPEGDVLDKVKCQTVLSSQATVKRYMKRPDVGVGAVEAMYGSR